MSEYMACITDIRNTEMQYEGHTTCIYTNVEGEAQLFTLVGVSYGFS